jgi:threonine synthase
MEDMRYASTRGHSKGQTFCDILLEGLAPDGGLYLPTYYPRIDSDQLESWRGLSYADLAFEILSLFATDIPPEDLRAICRKTYDPKIFSHRAKDRAKAGGLDRDTDDVAPLTWLEAVYVRDRTTPTSGMALLELSNGPTLAFKDIALQLVGNLFEYVLEKRGETLNVLGATSGDTGSAAEFALAGKKGVRVFMLSPNGKMSPFQRAQMYGLQDENVFNIAVNGMFDDAQDVVKAVSNDAEFKAKFKIGAVNSINWARIAAQVVYYFKAYLLATDGPGEKVSFTVPTGNFGNVCAGHIARRMGLPIGRLVVATNENDVLDEFFRTGIYRPRKGSETEVTSSPSMDISKASNFERFLFDVLGRDPFALRHLVALLDTSKKDMPGEIDLNPHVQAMSLMKTFGFSSNMSVHEDRIAAIREAWKDVRTVIDTHTADAFFTARTAMLDGEVMIVLETAQAAKFEDTIEEALGFKPERPDGFDGIENLPQKVEVMDPDVEAIKAYIARICSE